ncbi:MAG: glycosyltransferase [Acidobacteria bacterium]|nr:MAG: glycosyltransferase [Acidobacteriota bacterium]
MAWLALCWKMFGQTPPVTRCAMLLLAAFSLLGFFRLARTVANSTVAACSTLQVAIYPVFFAQSSLAQVDLPAAGLIFWGLESYLRNRRTLVDARAPWPALIWFSLAALAKETAILVPLALLLCQALSRISNISSASHSQPASDGKQSAVHPGAEKPSIVRSLALLVPAIPLALWYAYHYARTGFVFGNPEFFRYNVQQTMHPLRILLALLLRIWQTLGYLELYVLTLACGAAMIFVPIKDAHGDRPRIPLPGQFTFLTVAIVYLISLSVVGGAVLARYMLPIVPLVILVCVSTIWRRLPAWKPVIAIIVLAFVSALFVNPPYGFSPEDNLAYRDYIRLHQRAETLLAHRYPNARVLTAWPASDELTRPYLGYVAKPMQVLKIEDFSAEQVLSAADARSRFDVALVFSTKYQPEHTSFDQWRLWQKWKSRYFGFHVDLTPEVAARVLGGRVVYVDRKPGQWIGIIEVEKIEEASILLHRQ